MWIPIIDRSNAALDAEYIFMKSASGLTKIPLWGNRPTPINIYGENKGPRYQRLTLPHFIVNSAVLL